MTLAGIVFDGLILTLLGLSVGYYVGFRRGFRKACELLRRVAVALHEFDRENPPVATMAARLEEHE